MARLGFLSRTFYALENDQFRTLWFGTLFSFLGMQMQVIARGFLAYDLTEKNSALGGVMLAFGVPQLLLSLWGGVVADRLPKKKVLFVSQAIIAANSAWLATMIAMEALEYWHLIAAGAVQGAGFAFVGPARQAFITDLVDRQAIGNAVVLQQLSMNSSRVVGPSIAGLLIAVPFVGTAGVYYLTTLGFVIAMLSLLPLPAGNPVPRENARSPLADLRDGLGYVRRNAPIRQLILTSFAVVMIGFPYQSFLPSIAADIYNVGAGGLGLLSSAGAVGAVVATVIVATYADHPKAPVLQPLAGVLFGVSLVGLGGTAAFIPGLLVMVAVGSLASAFQSLNNSLTMTYTDYEYHGRVQSIAMLSWSLFGLAALPIGIIADQIGLRETIALQGVLCAGLVLAIRFFGRAGAQAPSAPARARAGVR
ncbi:MAG: MFS transporter [Dehalococcoidia bacterium]|nr:MFS transporter [Dehalococcoidia bacterium]